MIKVLLYPALRFRCGKQLDVYKRQVADRAGVEIILAFKSFAMWKSFHIFREYIRYTTASSVYEARLTYEEFGSKAHTYSPAYMDTDFPVIMRCSSHITFNSFSQFRRFYPMVEALSLIHIFCPAPCNAGIYACRAIRGFPKGVSCP